MTQRSVSNRRNESLERTKSYTWSNSKACRLASNKTGADLNSAIAKWEAQKANHITHLESLRAR